MSNTTVVDKKSQVESGQETKVAAPDVSRETNLCQSQTRRVVVPEYRVNTTEDAHVIQVFVPGVSQKGLRIELENRWLKIKAAADEQEGFDNFRESYTEFSAVDYACSFRIPEGVDVEGVGAVLKHGLLRVTLPKAEALQKKTIQVNG